MKKISYLLSVVSVGCMLAFTSCSKSDDDNSVAPLSADKTITLNSVSNPKTKKDTLYIMRDRSTVVIQSSAVTSTSTDLKRVYIYKKSYTTSNTTPAYISYNGNSDFKKDGNNNYYYEIPASEKNNTSITLTVPVAAESNPNSIGDEYAFYYTDNSNFNQSSDTPLLGPAQFFIVFGKLNESTGYKINNVNGPNTGAFDLRSLASKSKSDSDGDKDMADSDYNASPEKPEFAGTFTSLNDTRFVAAPSGFDYANATDLTIQSAYATVAGNILTPAFVTSPVVKVGDVYIARIRGGSGVSDYAAIKITGFVPETSPAQTGAGKNNEYIEFAVKKNK